MDSVCVACKTLSIDKLFSKLCQKNLFSIQTIWRLRSFAINPKGIRSDRNVTVWVNFLKLDTSIAIICFEIKLFIQFIEQKLPSQNNTILAFLLSFTGEEKNNWCALSFKVTYFKV